MSLPPVLMVFTGGTISMKVVPGKGALPASGGREILENVPEIASLARVRCEDFDRLPGPHWTPARMMELARLLDERLASGEFIGAVVTHGTDTLEETAYLLDLVLRTNRPVVLTGAMKTADDPAWDGPANLTAAVRAVKALQDVAAGVTVMFGGTLHAASEVTKSHTELLTAFTSTSHGAIGSLDEGGFHVYRRLRQPRERIATERIESRVDLVTACIGADDRFIRQSIASGARGIVVAAMGGGNVPPPMLSAVRDAVGAGLAVVVSSRCGHGSTGPRYGYEGGGVTLRDAGAMFAGELTPQKARIKLMVLLGAGTPPDGIRSAFEQRGS